MSFAGDSFKSGIISHVRKLLNQLAESEKDELIIALLDDFASPRLFEIASVIQSRVSRRH